MNLTVKPSKLNGVLNALPSKSLTHRAIIAAALSDGVSVLKNVVFSNDVLETLHAVEKLGINYKFCDGVLKIFGGVKRLVLNKKFEKIEIKCLECASTARFLIPIVAALGLKVKFIFGKRLFKRLCDCGWLCYGEIGKCSFKVNRILKPGYFHFKKCLTSQYITGFFLILPILNENSFIFFDDETESKFFIDLTINFLKNIGIKLKKIEKGFKIYANQTYFPFNFEIEGDYSCAAFFAVAGCFSKIKIKGLNIDSYQADSVIVKILNSCGVKTIFSEKFLTVQPVVGNLKSFEFNLKNNVDLAPILAVLASFCVGESKLFGISRLKFKESNRLNSILNLINGLGGSAKLFKNCLIIKGVGSFSGGVVNCYNDHRIAMAAAIASCKSKGNIVLIGAECVAKSWPNFFEVFKNLGGVLIGIDLE